MGAKRGTNRVVKSDEKAFDIVDQLQEMGGAGVSELARTTGMPKSTVHIHLKTLEQHGFVVQRDDGYHIGLRFLDLGIYARDNLDVYHAARPKVKELAEETDEQVWCLVEENGLGVYIAGAIGDRSVMTDARIGARPRLHHLAAGKAILAQLPRDRVDEIIEQQGLPARTPHTITEPRELHQELREVRQQGFALNQEETILGLNAVGVPIRDADGEVLGGVAVSGAANRMTHDRCTNEIADLLLSVGNEIELNLTYHEFPTSIE